jgi:hypothetical protein
MKYSHWSNFSCFQTNNKKNEKNSPTWKPNTLISYYELEDLHLKISIGL